MNPISIVFSAVSQQTIAALQAQMARYSQTANGQNSQASSDYKALQAAIKSGNVSDAQAALARLQRDSRSANPAAPAATSAFSPANSLVGGDHDNGGSTMTGQLGGRRPLDITA